VIDAPEGRIYPGCAIVPIIRFDTKTGGMKELLGTGFFVSEQGVLMSVNHVLGVQIVEPGEAMGVQIAPVGGGRGFVYPIVNVRASRDYDLALADVPSAEGFQVLQISRADPEGIPDLLTWDYSTGLRGGWLPDGSEACG